MAVTIVQSKAATKYDTPADSTLTATFDSTPTEGNTLVAVYIGAQGWVSGAFSISGTGWTEHQEGITADPPYTSRASYTKVAGASEPTAITVTGQSNDAGALYLLELDGILTSDIFEAQNTGYSGTAGTSQNSGDVSPAAAAFLICAGHCWNTTADQDFTHSANWTELFDVSGQSGGGATEMNSCLAYREVAAGTYSNTVSWTNTSTYGGGTAYILALNVDETAVETSGVINGGGGISATVTKNLNQILRPASTIAAGTWDTGPTTGQSLDGYTSDDSDSTYIEDTTV